MASRNDAPDDNLSPPDIFAQALGRSSSRITAWKGAYPRPAAGTRSIWSMTKRPGGVAIQGSSSAMSGASIRVQFHMPATHGDAPDNAAGLGQFRPLREMPHKIQADGRTPASCRASSSLSGTSISTIVTPRQWTGPAAMASSMAPLS